MTHQFSEDALVQKYFIQAAFSPFGLELQDDAACMRVNDGYELVVTCDTIVAGVHFFEDDPIGAIAKKALRVNLSDLAAKGAKPVGFVMSLALPEHCFAHEWLEIFSAALTSDACFFNCPLLGGDTVKTKGVLTITITAFGEVPIGKMVKRTSARAGDLLFVTGTIGDAAMGLVQYTSPTSYYTPPSSGACLVEARFRAKADGRGSILIEEEIKLDSRVEPDYEGRGHLEYRRLIPQPRLGIVPILQKYASAALDISDGFAGDCMKFLSYSNLGIEIKCEHVPLSEAVRNILHPSSSLLAGEGWGEGVLKIKEQENPSSAPLGFRGKHDSHDRFLAPLNLPQGEKEFSNHAKMPHKSEDERIAYDEIWQTILSGGDDYEILFSVAPENEGAFLKEIQKLDLQITRLGMLTTTQSVNFLHNNKELILLKTSYSHS